MVCFFADCWYKTKFYQTYWSASSAVIGCPVRLISMALDLPTALGSLWVPPAPGMTAMFVSGCKNLVVEVEGLG